MRWLARALMLTRPLGNQEPFTRSAHVPTSGWPLSPDHWTFGVTIWDGQCVGQEPLVNKGEGNMTWVTSVAACVVSVRRRTRLVMQRVCVLDADKRPLMLCRPARARRLLTQKKAAVYRRFPFTSVLKAGRPTAEAQALRVKLDPGSQTTGMAV